MEDCRVYPIVNTLLLIPKTPYAVLATDMEAHTEMVRDLGELGNALGADLCSNMAEWRPEQRLLAMQMAVHCADIGNPAKPVATSMNWAARITSEFLLQACADPKP